MYNVLMNVKERLKTLTHVSMNFWIWQSVIILIFLAFLRFVG